MESSIFKFLAEQEIPVKTARKEEEEESFWAIISKEGSIWNLLQKLIF